MSASLQLSIDDVRVAARRLEGRVVRTPVIRSLALDRICGAQVWMKAEACSTLVPLRRGALHAVGQLDPELRRGIVTYSSGNHAQAVAWAGVPIPFRRPSPCRPMRHL